jgi:hypothetical protein
VGDDELIDLLRRILAGKIDVDTFERDYLAAYKDAPIGDPGLQPSLGRAFLAVEGYDRSVTPETETVHNISFDTMMRELLSVWADLESYRARQVDDRPPT